MSRASFVIGTLIPVTGPSVREIARQAGVSPSTASAVLARRDVPVAPETRARILSTARHLGFRRSETPRIAILRNLSPPTGDRTNHVDLRTIAIVNHAARTRPDYSFAAVARDVDPLSLPARFAGALLIDGDVVREFAPVFERLGLPYVGTTSPEGRHRVHADHCGGALLATLHLAEAGHIRIAHLSGDPRTYSTGLRRQGFLDGLRLAGLADDDCPVLRHPRELLPLLHRPRPPTAVFAYCDATAVDLVRAATRAGFEVPRELSVVGFDNEPASSIAEPPLTTVDYNLPAYAQAVLDLLAAQIDGEPISDEPVIVPTELVLRQSVATPRRLTRTVRFKTTEP